MLVTFRLWRCFYHNNTFFLNISDLFSENLKCFRKSDFFWWYKLSSDKSYRVIKVREVRMAIGVMLVTFRLWRCFLITLIKFIKGHKCGRDPRHFQQQELDLQGFNWWVCSVPSVAPCARVSRLSRSTCRFAAIQVQFPTDFFAPRCAKAAHAHTGVTTLQRKSHRFVLKICFVQVCQIYVKSCGFQATAPAAAAAARPSTAAANSARKRNLKSHIWICYACGAKAFNSGNQLAQHQRGKKCKLNLLRHDLTWPVKDNDNDIWSYEVFSIIKVNSWFVCQINVHKMLNYTCWSVLCLPCKIYVSVN